MAEEQEEVAPPPLLGKPKAGRSKDRLTVVETVSHQRAGQNPRSWGTPYSRDLETREQPYEREITVNEEWQPLETGWIQGCGLLCIYNRGGQFSQRQPTSEQLAEAALQDIEVSFADGVSHIIVPVGESCRVVPVNIDSIRLRSCHGEIPCIVLLIPD